MIIIVFFFFPVFFINIEKLEKEIKKNRLIDYVVY